MVLLLPAAAALILSGRRAVCIAFAAGGSAVALSVRPDSHAPRAGRRRPAVHAVLVDSASNRGVRVSDAAGTLRW